MVAVASAVPQVRDMHRAATQAHVTCLLATGLGPPAHARVLPRALPVAPQLYDTAVECRACERCGLSRYNRKYV